MENKVLGKGLSALIPERSDLLSGETIKHLDITEIRPNSLQPRINYDDDSLLDLVNSIKEKGILQPILVRKKDAGYEVIAGERRFRAALKLNLEKIPVIIKNVSDQDAFILALVENIQREQLNAIEEAHAFKKLVDEFDFTQDKVAQSVGKDRTTIANLIRLLKLPEEIQKGIQDGFLSVGHARALLGVEEVDKQRFLFDHTVQNGISVRELEKLIKDQATLTTKAELSSNPTQRQKNIYLASLEDDLQKFLGTKIRIKSNQKKGKIVIDFYSMEDLDRLVNTIKS